jgi:anti-anti-sigma factor
MSSWSPWSARSTRPPPAARAFLTAKLAEKPTRLIIDLGGVTFLASAGLRLLLDLRSTAHDAGLDLDLAGVESQAVRLVLRATHLTEVFTILTSRQDALSQGPPSAPDLAPTVRQPRITPVRPSATTKGRS